MLPYAASHWHLMAPVLTPHTLAFVCVCACKIHCLADGSIHIYSRNAENTTEKYPDIVQLIPKVIRDDVKSFILDTEAVAIDTTTGKLLPFQMLSTRSKKAVKIEDIKVQVCVFAFDLMYLNGQVRAAHNGGVLPGPAAQSLWHEANAVAWCCSRCCHSRSRSAERHCEVHSKRFRVSFSMRHTRSSRIPMTWRHCCKRSVRHYLSELPSSV